MEDMMKMMENMMGKMCSEDKMEMMNKFCEKCFDSLSEDEKKEFFKKEFFKKAASGEGTGAPSWDQMASMMMTQMGMMNTMMMKDMMKGDGSKGGHGPGGGHGPSKNMKPMMAGPMRMMKKMADRMGPAKEEKAEQEEEPTEKTAPKADGMV